MILASGKDLKESLPFFWKFRIRKDKMAVFIVFFKFFPYSLLYYLFHYSDGNSDSISLTNLIFFYHGETDTHNYNPL